MISYEEVTTKRLSEIDGSRNIEEHSQKRVSRSASQLTDEVNEERLKSNRKLSDSYIVSYPSDRRQSTSTASIKSTNSTIKANSDDASVCSDRTIDQLSDYDFPSGSNRIDDDISSVTSRRSMSSRVRNRVQDSFDERLEDLVCDVGSRSLMNRSFWNGFDDEDFDDEDSFFSNAFNTDFFRDKSQLMNKKSLLSSNLRTKALLNSIPTSRFHSLKLDENEYEDSGIFSETASIKTDQSSLGGLEESRDRKRHHQEKYQQMKEEECEKFQVSINVKGFKPNELLVKTEGSKLVVCAEIKDNSERRLIKEKQLVARNFRQEFDLPEDVNPYEVISSLGSDGYLKIEAPVSRPTSKADSFR